MIICKNGMISVKGSRMEITFELLKILDGMIETTPEVVIACTVELADTIADTVKHVDDNSLDEAIKTIADIRALEKELENE